MLTLLTGTYYPAKKKYISENISKLIDNGKKVYLIVPEQASFDRGRDFLFEYGEKKSNRLTVTSFTHLSRDVLEDNGLKVRHEADEAAKNVLMSLAVEEQSDSLNIYRRYSGKLPLIKELLSTYSEIKQAGLDAQELSNVSHGLSEGTLKDKTEELSRIFFAYEAVLGERFSDSADNLAVMTEFLRKNIIFEGATVFFDDFIRFSGAQIKLMSEIIDQSEEAFVSVNAPDSADAADSEAFVYEVAMCKKLRREVSKKSIRCFEVNTGNENPVPEFSCIASSLFCPEKDEFEGNSDAVNVISAENKYEECDMAALYIKYLIEKKGWRCRDIAVTERGNTYAAAMVASLKKYSIPVFEDKRVALFDYPLVRLILSAVNIAAYGFVSEEILAYIKTGLAGVDRLESSMLENYIYIWRIDRGEWLKPFTENPDGFGVEMDERRESQLKSLNETREKIVTPLLHLKAALAQENAEKSCEAVFNYMKEVKADKEFLRYADFLYRSGNEAGAVECSGVWDSVTQALDALHEALGKRVIKPARFYELLNIILCSGDVGRIPSGIDEIVIGQANRTRFSEPRAMFVLGANEDVFPPPASAGGLFSPKERRVLIENNFELENLPETVYSEERMIAYSVLTAPSEKLYVSYSRSGVSGGEKQPSVIVREIEKIVPGLNFIKDTDVPPIDRIAGAESAFEQCAAHYTDNSVFSETLKQYIKESPYASRLSSLDSVTESKPFEIKDHAKACELFGEDMKITPSRAEMYYKCPFMYFCRYGLNVAKLTPADLDARINGLLVHHTLEVVFTENTNDEIRDFTDEKMHSEIDRITEDYIESYMGGRDKKSVLFNRSLDKTKNTIFEILSRLKQEFGSCSFVTKDVELSINDDGEVSPYKIILSDGGSISIGGYVDRVDVMEDGDKEYLRVIDYKTGTKTFKLGEVFDGLNMQMLIYLMCLWDNGHERYGNVVPAGILYVPAKKGNGTVGRNASEEEIAGMKLKNGVMNGMILENEKVLRGMEADAEGRFIDAKIDSKGRMKGNFISLENFRRLHKRIDDMLSSMGMKLHTGQIEALPVAEGAYKSTCEYCDFADICRRNSSSPIRNMHNITHDKAIEELKEEDDRG